MTWTYEVLSEYSEAGRDLDYASAKDFKLADNDPVREEVSVSSFWVISVIRLGVPVSFDRDKMTSRANVSEGGHVRAGTLLITEDCTAMTISNAKASHTKSLNATLLPSMDYLYEILPGDWVFAWIVHGEEKFKKLVERIKKGDVDDSPNKWLDGLKFMGRVQDIRKRLQVNASGFKTLAYQLSATGFKELDTTFFYDSNLSEHDIQTNNLGNWLARMGKGVEDLFKWDQTNLEQGNCNTLVVTLLDLILGKGVASTLNTTNNQLLQQTTGSTTAEAPFAYLVPRQAGLYLGIDNASKPGGMLSYCDLLGLLQGVQTYEDPGFIPTLDWSKPNAVGKHWMTKHLLLGTFMPLMPEFTNRPLWDILQQFSNPAVNEMFTSLRIAEVWTPNGNEGRVLPVITFRQIPFTTDAYTGAIRVARAGAGGTAEAKVEKANDTLHFTRFLDLPRWKVGASMVYNADIGRSDATRCNFVHVYGQDALNAANYAITDQLVENPPARDDLDIQRSGIAPYMTTVACAVRDEVGGVPAKWISLVADRMMGSHLTLNGSLMTVGVQAPICEGDNLEWDGVVYHIEAVNHNCSIDSSGIKTWTTSFSLSNGMAAARDDKAKSFPRYPSMRYVEGDTTLEPSDSNAYRPGVTIERRYVNEAQPVDDKDLSQVTRPEPKTFDQKKDDASFDDFIKSL